MKTAVILLLAAGLLIALLLAPVGVQVEYDVDGFSLRLRVGPVWRQVFPAPPKKEKQQKKQQKPQQPKPKKQLGGKLALIRAVLQEHCGAAWRLNHRAHETETGLWHWEWAFQTEE